MTTSVASPITWFGGKSELAPTIIALLPPHDVYVEPFAGSAAVLLLKPPAPLDVLNDVDDGLVNFYRVLREQAGELARLLELTPYARRELELCKDWRAGATELERARRWFVVSRFKFSAAGEGGGGAWSFNLNGENGAVRVNAYRSAVRRLEQVARRLERVQVDAVDWRLCLERYDSPRTTFYVDPPYVASTRSAGRYLHELTDDDHAELVGRLCELAGSALVSGYDHDLYRELERAGYERLEYDRALRAAKSTDDGSRGQRRTEVIWRRSRAGQERLFEVAVP